MAPARRTADLLKQLQDLTGVEPRRNSDGWIFRLTVTSKDAKTHTSTVQLDTHQREVQPYMLPQISRRLMMTKQELVERLEDDDWGPTNLTEHLSSFTKQELRQAHMGR